MSEIDDSKESGGANFRGEEAAAGKAGAAGELNCAYVELVMKGDAYVAGALVSAFSLRKTGTKHSTHALWSKHR